MEKCKWCGKPKREHNNVDIENVEYWFCEQSEMDMRVFEPAPKSAPEAPLEKELTTWVNQNGSVETKLMPKNTGFEIENYEGTLHGFKHILESCFLKINDRDIVKVKMHFQVMKVKQPLPPQAEKKVNGEMNDKRRNNCGRKD